MTDSAPAGWGRRGLGVLALGLVLSAATRRADGAPNPFGQSSAQSRFVLDPDGGWEAVEQRQIELRLAYELSFRVAFPDGIRLPDEPERPLPGLLMPDLGPVTGSFNGQSEPIEVERIGRRVEFGLPARDAEVGVHDLEVRHARSRASLVVGDRLHTYLQAGISGPITIVGEGIIAVGRHTRPGVFEPVGTATATGWELPRNDTRPAAWSAPSVLRVERAARRVAEPRISYA
ncbi:hypothetical protein AADG42_12060 [Ammonicoccus fulvus]|uniref:Uncharacterized protein n=1 Tax=Ammonicoccus fulvus TaxID=3138240 RepID=A0ABZ3FPL8_9ACTN